MGSHHLDEELIGGDCRSRSPLPNPSKICKNHRREGRGSKLKRLTNGGEREMLNNTLETLKTVGKKAPFYGKPVMAIGSFPTFSGGSRSKTRSNRTKTEHTKKVLELFGLNSVQFPVLFLVEFPV
jgi:hypothetical protein